MADQAVTTKGQEKQQRERGARHAMRVRNALREILRDDPCDKCQRTGKARRYLWELLDLLGMRAEANPLVESTHMTYVNVARKQVAEAILADCLEIDLDSYGAYLRDLIEEEENERSQSQ